MNRYMPVVALLVGILLGSVGCYVYFLSVRQPRSYLVNTSGNVNAYKYLINSYNSTLGLCYLYPGSDVYWVCHDNILASCVLEQWNKTVAGNITKTVRSIAQTYGLNTSEDGLPLDCKMEALLGYEVPFLLSDTESMTLNSSYYGSVLNTEITMPNSYLNITAYADTLCYASLVEWRNENYSGADFYFQQAKAMWDGKGFKDTVAAQNGYYATYKLGLFYMTSQVLGLDFDFKRELVDTVWACQLLNGGFKTDYYEIGSFPNNSKTNTETTSIILLANIPTNLEITDYNGLARELTLSRSLNYIFMTTIIILTIAVVYLARRPKSTSKGT
jgi:hypothetical protein